MYMLLSFNYLLWWWLTPASIVHTGIIKLQLFKKKHLPIKTLLNLLQIYGLLPEEGDDAEAGGKDDQRRDEADVDHLKGEGHGTQAVLL